MTVAIQILKNDNELIVNYTPYEEHFKNHILEELNNKESKHSLVTSLSIYETTKFKLILEKLKFLLSDARTKEKE